MKGFVQIRKSVLGIIGGIIEEGRKNAPETCLGTVRK